MKIEIGKQWVKALRSNKYRQGLGLLERVTDSGSDFCCLGVLCNLAAEEGVVERREGMRAVYYAGINLWLPKEVMEWAGMHPCSEYLPLLASLNDAGKPFSEIADIIEARMVEL